MRAAGRKNQIARGAGQLTLVEHALCPLNVRHSLAGHLVHETCYQYSDKQRRRHTATVRVLCPLGLSAHDELLLWGCLALTLADAQSGGELHATRHYILRQLGLIDQHARRGGRQYEDLHGALERLSAVRYLNDGFYDPIRGEHRRVSFGFFSYSLPIDVDSSRAWRISWDPVFFEFAQAAKGTLRFDLPLYRKLDPASRRLFLFLTKLFGRHETTHPIELKTLAVNVIGFSASLRASDQKVKVLRCIRKLVDQNVIRDEANPIRKVGAGRYRIILRRGVAFHRRRRPSDSIESPLVEPLTAIGFDEPGIRRLLRRFPHQRVREWCDITLAARERFGGEFFRSSPAAYLVDNLKSVSQGTRTPPDWWSAMRKEEVRRQAHRARSRRGSSAESGLPAKAMDALDDVQRTVFEQFLAAGQPEALARENARRFADARKTRSRNH